MKTKRAIPTTAVGYCRVSTADQSRDGVSLDAQQDRVERYCELHELPLSRIYIDAGVSGGTPLAERPQGGEVVAAVARGEVSAVVALKLDRLFRSTIDCLQSVQLWDKQRVALHLIDFAGGTLDTRTAMGRFFLTMAAGFGELERQMIGERTSAALQHKKRQGVRLGGVPFGFRARWPGGPLEEDPAEIEIAREILRLRAESSDRKSYRGIARLLTSRSVPTRAGGAWKAETVRRIVGRADRYDSPG